MPSSDHHDYAAFGRRAIEAGEDDEQWGSVCNRTQVRHWRVEGARDGEVPQLLWLEAPSHGLPATIDAVVRTTSSTDPGLRNVAVKFCTYYNPDIVTDDRLCNIIKDHGELGLDVLREVDASAVENCQLTELLYGQCVTLKEELAQMVKEAS